MSGEAVAGSLIGYLRLDADSFFRTIEEAQLAADKLDSKNVDVKVRADTAGAETKLAAVAASEDKVDHSNMKMAQSSMDMSNGMGAVMKIALALSPAIVPLAAATTGLAVGFGAMGAAGVLAVVGIMQEMKAGTALGGAYTAMLGTLKGDLTTLGHTAAAGVLRPFQKEVATLQGQMPQLNSIIGEFSVITGKTAGVLVSGLVAGFIALEPLARDAGVYILGLSTRFAALMSGPGVVTFGDYVRSVFPQVMQAVESIVGAALHLVAALAPLGLGTLGILRTFTDLINALPVDVLAVLAQTAASVYIGFSAFKMLSGPLASVGTALKAVGVSAETAAAGVRSLTIAAGVIGAIITVATLLFSAHAESVRKNQQATNDYTDALRTSNGVLDESIRLMTVKTITEMDGFTTAKQYGITQTELTDAFLGLGTAQADVTAKLAAGASAMTEGKSYSAQYAAQGSDTTKKILGLSNAINGNSGAFQSAKQTYKDQTAAMATGTVTTQAATLAEQESTLAHLSGTDATKAQKQALTELNTEMSAELGLALTLAGATSGYDSALLTMTETLKKNNGTLSEHTREGISDRQAIESTAQALQSKRAQEIQTGTSTAAATIEYQKNSGALLDQMGKLYGTKSAAYIYMQQLLAIPKDVSTTVGLKTGPAKTALAALLATIPTSRTISLYLAAGATTLQALNYLTGINKRGINSANGNILNANGNILTAHAMGSITQFASGGENHVAQIAPAGAMRLWAEPETGGEAYIPLASSKRARSTAIWEETGKRLGVGSGQSGPSGPALNIEKYYEQGQSPHLVAADLAFLMRTT